MTNGTIIFAVGMAFQTFISDAPDVDIVFFTDLFIFLVVMAAPAVHGEMIADFRLIPVVTGFTLDIIGIGRPVIQMVENHQPSVGFEFNFFWFLHLFEIFGIVTELAAHRIPGMAVGAIFADTPFMDAFVLAYFDVFLAVMTFSAVHYRTMAFAFRITMVAFVTVEIFEGGVILMVKNDAAALGCESNPDGWMLFFKYKSPNGYTHQNHQQQSGEYFFFFS
jgi:hypothetical protein